MVDMRNTKSKLWKVGGGWEGHADDSREGGNGVPPKLGGRHTDSHRVRLIIIFIQIAHICHKCAGTIL